MKQDKNQISIQSNDKINVVKFLSRTIKGIRYKESIKKAFKNRI